jgi:hypothetical protein
MTIKSESETFSARGLNISNVWVGKEHVPDLGFHQEEEARSESAPIVIFRSDPPENLGLQPD